MSLTSAPPLLRLTMCRAELQEATDGPSSELVLGARNCCLLTGPDEDSMKLVPLSGNATECLRFSGPELLTLHW